MTETDGRLKLTILGGFLGSGKTTWLRHQLHAKTFGRVHVIVNEAAGTPVDDALLQEADGLTVLAGGCVCCNGRDMLQKTLLRLADERSQMQSHSQRIDQIVLETSGLADPSAIINLIQDHPILARQIVITDIIVIVDTHNGIEQLHQEPLCRAQIETADRLILTKTDISDPTSCDSLRATLAQMAPAAAQSAATFGSDASLPALSSTAQSVTLNKLSGETTATILPALLMLGQTPDWTAFTVWLSALLHARGDQIVRVKGVVQTPAGRLLLQAVRRSAQSPEILPETKKPQANDNTIAIIGRGFTQAEIETSFRRYVLDASSS